MSFNIGHCHHSCLLRSLLILFSYLGLGFEDTFTKIQTVSVLCRFTFVNHSVSQNSGWDIPTLNKVFLIFVLYLSDCLYNSNSFASTRWTKYEVRSRVWSAWHYILHCLLLFLVPLQVTIIPRAETLLQ